MTSKLTREERVQALYDLKAGQVISLADIENVKMLARMALAAMDSEPDRNPVLAYADSYRDMANQGVESVPIWSVITDLERNIAPLYRHAQPAKTVQPVMFIDGDISSEDADKLAKVIRELHEKDERPLAKMAWIIRENPHPTNECDMPKAQPAPVVPGELKEAAADLLATLDDYPEQLVPINRKSSVVRALRAAMLPAAPACTCPSGDGSLRWPCPVHPGNSPVIPDGSASMLRRWLAFGRGMQNAGSQLPRNLIAETEEMLAAAPQSPGSEPATVPGKWIPVSERMPSNEPGSYEYLVYETLNNRVQHDYWNSEGEHSNLESFWNHYGNYVTHWQPLPEPPQELK